MMAKKKNGSKSKPKRRQQNERKTDGAAAPEKTWSSVLAKSAALLGTFALTLLTTWFFQRYNAAKLSTEFPTDTDLDCNFYMAESTIKDSGWGIFSAKPIPPSKPVLPGEVVVQLTDFTEQQAAGMHTLLHSYAWAAIVTGGQFEANTVHSIIPGVGMLANGHPTEWNVVPHQATIDKMGLDRETSPAAGSSSHYQGFQHYSHKEIAAGEEILVNYGSGYAEKVSSESLGNTVRPIEYLREHGICLDHIKPGLSEFGVGAFATRNLAVNTVIAPVPVLPVTRAAIGNGLLLNYCIGQKNSSVLLYPYSPTVNLINHNANPNAALRWVMQPKIPIEVVKTNQPSGMLLELVALRHIRAGEEVTIDYGNDWKSAWKKHVETWEAPVSDGHVYAKNMNKLATNIRTLDEQEHAPYPPNLQTACFIPPQGLLPTTSADVLQYPVQYTHFHPRMLQVCDVTGRDEANVYYQVELVNGKRVEGVPRAAIKLIDKPYTTDQHLKTAFRHEIGADSIIPEHWMDLQ